MRLPLMTPTSYETNPNDTTSYETTPNDTISYPLLMRPPLMTPHLMRPPLMTPHLMRRPLTALTQFFAEFVDDSEDVGGEVDAEVQDLEVWQLDPQQLVHGRELQLRVGLHPVLVQRRPRPQQPDPLRRPPEGVIGPVERYVCKR